MAILIAGGTQAMRWFSACFLWLKFVGERSPSKILKLVALFLSFPCFKCSHFCFKLVYALNQRRLRGLASEDFFLEFYDCRIATGCVVNILQSLREIEGGLKRAEASNRFTYHDVSSKLKNASQIASCS